MRKLLALFIFALAGCKPSTPPLAPTPTPPATPEPTVKVDGSVFIVTEGGQNFKLGLVEVGLIPASSVKENLDRFVEGIESSAASRAEEYDKLLAQAQSVRAAAEKVDAKVKELTDTRDKVEEILEQKAIVSNYEVTLKYGETLTEDITKAVKILAVSDYLAAVASAEGKAKIDEDALITDRVQNAGRELALLPNVLVDTFIKQVPYVESTKTDAEGKFEFEVKPGAYVLGAVASRDVGKNTERYYWFVPVQVESGKPKVQVMLSNDTLARTIDDITKTTVASYARPYYGTYLALDRPRFPDPPRSQWRVETGIGHTVMTVDGAALTKEALAESEAKSKIDKTRFPRTCVLKRKKSIVREDGVLGISEGAEFELISATRGKYQGNEFDITDAEFDEK